MIGIDTRCGDQFEVGAALIQQVSQSAGHILLMGKAALDGGEDILSGNGACKGLGQLAERRELALANHAHCIFHYHA
jgi:hypothetical protein